MLYQFHQAWCGKLRQDPGGILEEAEEEGGLPAMGSYVLPTQEIKGG